MAFWGAVFQVSILRQRICVAISIRSSWRTAKQNPLAVTRHYSRALIDNGCVCWRKGIEFIHQLRTEKEKSGIIRPVNSDPLTKLGKVYFFFHEENTLIGIRFEYFVSRPSSSQELCTAHSPSWSTDEISIRPTIMGHQPFSNAQLKRDLKDAPQSYRLRMEPSMFVPGATFSTARRFANPIYRPSIHRQENDS